MEKDLKTHRPSSPPAPSQSETLLSFLQGVLHKKNRASRPLLIKPERTASMSNPTNNLVTVPTSWASIPLTRVGLPFSYGVLVRFSYVFSSTFECYSALAAVQKALAHDDVFRALFHYFSLRGLLGLCRQGGSLHEHALAWWEKEGRDLALKDVTASISVPMKKLSQCQAAASHDAIELWASAIADKEDHVGPPAIRVEELTDGTVSLQIPTQAWLKDVLADQIQNRMIHRLESWYLPWLNCSDLEMAIGDYNDEDNPPCTSSMLPPDQFEALVAATLALPVAKSYVSTNLTVKTHPFSTGNLWACHYTAQCQNRPHELNACKFFKHIKFVNFPCNTSSKTCRKAFIPSGHPSEIVTRFQASTSEEAVILVSDVDQDPWRRLCSHVRGIIHMDVGEADPSVLMTGKLNSRGEEERGVYLGFVGGSCERQQRSLREQLAIEIMQELCGIAQPDVTHRDQYLAVLACIPAHGVWVRSATNDGAPGFPGRPTMYFCVPFPQLYVALGHAVLYTWSQRAQSRTVPSLVAEAILFLQWIPLDQIRNTTTIDVPGKGVVAEMRPYAHDPQARGMRCPRVDLERVLSVLPMNWHGL